MKRIIAAIAMTLALAATAYAGVVATIPNKAGNTIKLTDGKHGDCSGDGWNLAFATGSGGRTITGCWMYSETAEEIVIVYEDGETYTYPVNSLRLTKYFNTKYNKGRSL